MEFDFPPDIIMLRDMLRRFVQKEARPLEMKYFTSGTLEPEDRTRLRLAIEQLGLWGITAPEEFGGGGLDTVSACLIEEELGKTFVPLETGDVPLPLYACSQEQITQFMEPLLAGERGAIIAAREPGPEGYDPNTWATTAAPDNGGYLLNGRKSLGAAPGANDFLILYASAPQGLSAFLLDGDKPEIRITQGPQVVLEIEDCIVEASALLGEEGRALRLGVDEAPRAWIRVGARYLGIVERLVEMGSAHARDWVTHGEPLAVRPAVQDMLAEMRVDLESARWLVYHAAWLADTAPAEDLRVPSAQVRLATGEMLQRAVDRTTMIFSGPGPSPEIEPGRMVRSVVPDKALQMALKQARAVIAAQELSPRDA